MAAKTVEGQAIRAALDKELAANAAASGRELAWSATELEILDLIEAHADRRAELTRRYDECDESRMKIALSTELRLTEVSMARLLKLVETSLPTR